MNHGSLTAYIYHGCRCDPCRAAMRDHMRAYQPRYRADRIARGVCIDCPGPLVPGRQRCEVHLERARRRKNR